MVDLVGYHGTSISNAGEIIKNGFEISKGDEEWIGDGVYFFLNGLSTKPEDQAEKWAIAQAWDNKAKQLKYRRFSVIRSNIRTNEEFFLDLTVEDGIDILNYLVSIFEEKISLLGKKLTYQEGMLINLARGEKILNIDVVKGNFYIKFKQERIKKVNFRTSNCTICTVFEPSKNILDKSIVKTGEIRI